MLILILFIFFLVCLVLGIPVAFGLGFTAVIGIIVSKVPIIAVAFRMFSGVDKYPLLAIPFYICAGNIMTSCGITDRLINLSNALIGFIRSSLAQVNILASIFFAGISGSDVADATAIGSALIPIMKKKNYTSEEAAIITGTSSIIGPIIPPSIRMIIYGALTGTSVIGLFLAGILPGLLLGFSLMIMTHILSLKRTNSMGNKVGNKGEERLKFSLSRAFIALKENIYTIPIPIIVVGGIYSGIFTVTEAGVVLLFYNLMIGSFIYKTLTYEKLKNTLLDSAMTTALVGFIIAAATVFSYLLSVRDFAPWLMNATQSFQENPMVFMLLITFIFFLLGCFVPVTVILIIFASYLPIMQSVTGLHPLHFGLIIVLVLGLGAITPPYGTVLYIVVYIAKTTVIRCIPTLLPYIITMIITLLIVIFFPWLSLYIPQLLGF